MSPPIDEDNPLAALSVPRLLSNYAAILDELRRREVVRTANNPLSDFAELLFCRAFGWTIAGNSAAGYDAKDAAGIRFQIKARRITVHNGSRQMSAIRSLDKDPFDQLAGVLMDSEFRVMRAVLIPVDIVRARSKHVVHTNSWKFLLKDEVWSLPGVRDVSAEIQAAAAAI